MTTNPPDSGAVEKPMFDIVVLARSRMTEAGAKRFRDESRQSIVLDDETGARVVTYIHPSGRILIDAVRLPKIP